MDILLLLQDVDRRFVLQIVQPGLEGLMDGSDSTLAPVFAADFAAHQILESTSYLHPHDIHL